MSLKQYMDAASEASAPVNISAEEAEFHLEQMMEAVQEIEFGLEELDRAEDMMQSLEELQTFVVSKEEFTDSEQKLILTNLTQVMATAGLLREAELPSMEAGGAGVKIAEKVIVSTLKAIYELVINMAKNIWIAVGKFIEQIRYGVLSVEQSNARMVENFQKVGNNTLLKKTTTLSGEAINLYVDGKEVKEGRDISNLLLELERQCSSYFGFYDKDLIAAGSQFATALERYDPANPEMSLKAIMDIANKINPINMAKVVKASLDKKTSVKDGGEFQKGRPLPGNKSIYFLQPYLPSSETDLLIISRSIRGRRANLRPTRPGRIDIGEVEIKTLGIADAVDINRQVKSLTVLVRNHLDNKDKFRRVEAQMEKAAARLKDTASAYSELDAKGKRYYEEAIRYVVEYAKWSSAPQIELVRQAISTCKASISACNKSAMGYVQPASDD